MSNATTLPPVPARTLSRAGLADMIPLLQQQQAQKIDIVVPASTLRSNGGALEIAGIEPVLTEDGVTELSGLYRPTSKADSDLSGLFGIPLKYVRRLRNDHLDLFDANVNGWAARETDKRVMLRLFYGHDENHPESVGIARAILSDRYGVQDNLDVVISALDGMRSAGLGADNISSLSLSDDNLYMFVEAPEVAVQAPKLLEGYRSPFSGLSGTDLPVIHAGFVVKNSETGSGALSVTPRLVVEVCKNGMTISKDAIRKVHLAGRMPEGQIHWHADTVGAANDLVRLQMRDAVSSFLSEDYVAAAVSKLEEAAGVPVDDAPKTIEVVSKQLSFSEREAAGILNHFIKGGQLTSGGVMQAVTSYSQEIEDVDRQHEVEASGIDAMKVAARVAA